MCSSDLDVSFALVFQLLEDFIPVWTAGVCSCLQPSDQITLFLLVQELQRQLEPDRLKMPAMQSGRDVHVHVEKSLHRPTQLGLFNLQLGQQMDEPLEGALIAVDPEKVDFAQVEDRLREFRAPCERAVGARVSRRPVAAHYRLENRGERSHADARRY